MAEDDLERAEQTLINDLQSLLAAVMFLAQKPADERLQAVLLQFAHRYATNVEAIRQAGFDFTWALYRPRTNVTTSPAIPIDPTSRPTSNAEG